MSANGSRRQITWSQAALVSFLLGMALVMDVRSLPLSTTGMIGGSTVGRLAAACVDGSCFLEWQPRFEAVVVRDPVRTIASGDRPAAPYADGDLLLIEPDTESWNDAAHALSEHPAESVYLSYTPIDEASGFWAVTRTHRKHAITMSYGSSFSGAERARARTLFLQSICDDRRGTKVKTDSRLIVGDYEETAIVWSGYLHNALAAILLAIFAWSLRWVPHGFRDIAVWARLSRERSRIARGLCPRCRYPRAGLTTEPCPECGHSHPMTAPS